MTHKPYPRARGGPVPAANRGTNPDAHPGAGRGLGEASMSKPRSAPGYRLAAIAALTLLAACDPFQPDNVQETIITPVSQCENLGGTPATRPAKDGTPWQVCTFRDTRVCDIAKLRVDNRCYTTVPDTAPGN